MNNRSVHLFFYPTAVVVIDDSQDYLENFSLRLNDDLAFKLFSSPQDALQYVNTPAPSSELLMRCVNHRRNPGEDFRYENVVAADVGAIMGGMKNARRFEERSVVIVDYDMPGMNGLEFCRMLNDPHIKKILLTGAADEKLAVSAFNNGIINNFVSKQDSDSVREINNLVYKLQDRYFSDKNSFIKSALNTSYYGFLIQPEFIELFNYVCSVHGVVEYYLTYEPGGYIMMTKKGSLIHIMVSPVDDLISWGEMLRDCGAPERLRRLVDNRQAMPYFWRHNGRYSTAIESWEEYLFPCEKLQSIDLYYSITENPDYYINHMPDYKYQNFLDDLDANIGRL